MTNTRPEWVDEILASNADVALSQAEVAATLAAILNKIDGIQSELKPTIDSVMNHPMLKMLGGRK